VSRGLTAAFLTAADAGTVYPAILAQFDFSGGEIAVWTGVGDLVHGGITFAGIGELGGMSAIEETEETRANGVQFNLSGIPSSMVAAVLGENYRNRTCTVQLALFASLTAAAPITAPAVMFVGRMDQAFLDDDGESATINLTAESRLIDLQRPRARRYTDEDQRAVYAGDVGLEYVAGLQDKEIMWGANNGSVGNAVIVQDYDTEG
jgi:hypothetical protein